MTRRELLLATLEKVTGQPKEHLKKVVEKMIEVTPDKSRWEEYLHDPELRELEAAFEAEASGILAWYAKLLMGSDELRQDRVQSIQQESDKMPRRGRRN